MADFIATTHPYLNSETLYFPTTFHTIRSRFAAAPGVLPQVLRQERQVSGYSALSSTWGYRSPSEVVVGK